MRCLALTAAAALSFVLPSAAHHGFTGRYDITAPLWIEGEVTEAYFGRPHAELTIATPADLAPPEALPDLAGAADVIGGTPLAVRHDSRGASLVIEFPPIEQFFALRDRVAVGDTVQLIAFRNCAAPHQLRAQWIQPAAGEPVARSGRVQYQVAGC